MWKDVRKNQRLWLVLLIVICMGIVVLGGMQYIASLRVSLTEQAAQNVLAVTTQQQQAFDNFISGDRERLHSFAAYFSQNQSGNTRLIRQQLTAFGEVDAFYTVIDLETGRFCTNKTDTVYQMGADDLAVYRQFSGSGVRSVYASLSSDDTMFGYYECFTFSDGVPGLIQKSYDFNDVFDSFSLSFYNDQGFSYVVNQAGDILLQHSELSDDYLYENVFDLLSSVHGSQESIDAFVQALNDRESGSAIFTGETGDFVYTYVPVENAEEWHLVSIVPAAVITAEANSILMDSQKMLGLLILILLICAVFVLMIWRTHKAIETKDREIEYQRQLFTIFSTYLTNNTDDVYMMFDAQTRRAEYLSPNAESVLGLRAQDFTLDFKAFEDAVYISGEQAVPEDLQRLAPGAALEAIVIEWKVPHTEERKWFRISIYCTLVQNKRKIIVYISDRTTERRVQDTLSDALKMARVASNAKSSFLSNISHDIRTPMNAIIGFVSLLRDDAEDPGLVREYAQRIDAASQHLLGLINDVLDMNKIESGNATLTLSEISLAEIIEEINAIIRPQARAKSQSFEIFASPFAHEHLQADKLRINQILINLLSNAVKYTPEGGDIQMRVEELPQVVDDYSRIRFTIQDNGIGMSEEYQRIIFDPFTREETSTTRQIQGTGLGMAITKSLVDLLGGSIHVASKPGEGSTFTVELELYISEQEDDPRFWARHGIAKMIVADDDEEICRNIVHVMEKAGVVTHYSTDGAGAVDMMRSAREAGQPYDLILLDWKMPTLDGIETARLIRKNYPDKIPILLFTAYDWDEIEQEAAEAGIHHFMPKPFFMSTFQEATRRVMGKQKKHGADPNSTVVQGKHILVVDDIEVNQIILVKILNSLGATCDVAGNGQEAVAAFEASAPGQYDLILMDVQMPVVNGYEATRAIRAGSHPAARTVPIIAMTANAFVDDVRDAIESGMDAHVAKPVQLDKLKATIQQVFDSRKAQQTDTAENERGNET